MSPRRPPASPAARLRHTAVVAVAALLTATLGTGAFAPGRAAAAVEAVPLTDAILVRAGSTDTAGGDPGGLRVYIDGTPVRAATADRLRLDRPARGASGAARFALAVPAEAGRHDVCVDTGTGADRFGASRDAGRTCTSVTVDGTTSACGPRPDDGGFYRAMTTDRDDGWLGADLVTAVDLPDGSVLWLFGDTDWGTRAASGAYAPGWTATTNSAILQLGGCTKVVGGRAGLVPPGRYGDASRLYWPSTAFVAAGRLYVGFNRIDPDSLVRERSELVELSLPDLRPVGMRVLPDTARQWTQAANVEGGWVLYHGMVGRDLYAARAPVTDPTALAYWDGGAWSDDPAEAVVVVAGAENGVVQRLGSGRWVTLSKRFLANDVVAWTAPAPTGPFARVAAPVADAHPPTPDVWVYMPSLHALPDGGWLVALNHNNWEPERIWAGLARYGPVFSVVDL